MYTNRIRRTRSWLLAAALTLGGTTLALAGGDGSEHHKQQTQAQKTSAQSKMINGEVVATKIVKLRGSNQRNLVAMIRTSEGSRKLVDLGPRDDARTLQLDVGDMISVRGSTANIRGRSVFLARQARTGDRTLTVDRSSQRMQFDRAVQQARQGGACPPSEG